jgi:hypothetical protein
MPFDPNLPPNNVQVKAQGLRGQLNGLYHEGVRQAACLFFQAIARQLGSHVSDFSAKRTIESPPIPRMNAPPD